MLMRDELMGRLGFGNVRDLLEIMRATRLRHTHTPAEYLYRYVLPQLEGARIERGILAERRCGLILNLGNGEQVIAWIDHDQKSEDGGWLTLERDEATPPQASSRWLRRVVADKVDSLIELLDELDGDADFEDDPREDEGLDEDWSMPVSLGAAIRTVLRKPGRKQIIHVHDRIYRAPPSVILPADGFGQPASPA
jgi:hypothetical protein